MSATTSGISEAAKIPADAQRRRGRHYDLPVTLSRRDAEDAVWEAWQATAAEWQSSDTETAITPEVRDAVIRFLELLPPGFPQPSVCGEPDGHISLEWYRNPRRIVSVSIGPDQIPNVADNELLARFILNSHEKRADGTVTPGLFMPCKWVELLVNRHREATYEETWSVGRHVAAERRKKTRWLWRLSWLHRLKAAGFRFHAEHSI